MNPRITPREYGLIKGALRRVFSRSELRNSVINRTVVPTDQVPEVYKLARPRVKTWVVCPHCHRYLARSDMIGDHIDPVIPFDKTLHDLSIEELVDRLWCVVENLQPMCEDCHDVKTKEERKLRVKRPRKKKPS